MRSLKSKFVSAFAWGFVPALAAVLPSRDLDVNPPAGKLLHYGMTHSSLISIYIYIIPQLRHL
jgi:cytosine/uracil/thiamine/allantoin permease